MVELRDAAAYCPRKSGTSLTRPFTCESAHASEVFGVRRVESGEGDSFQRPQT